MENWVDGITYFKILEEDQKHEIFVKIGKEIDKCRKCPIGNDQRNSYFLMSEREEFCGECPVYKEMHRLAEQLPNYDLTKRQRFLLNKEMKDITGAEVKELFFSGVSKLTIAKRYGIVKSDSKPFKELLASKGIDLPKQYRLTEQESEYYNTLPLGSCE